MIIGNALLTRHETVFAGLYVDLFGHHCSKQAKLPCRYDGWRSHGSYQFIGRQGGQAKEVHPLSYSGRPARRILNRSRHRGTTPKNRSICSFTATYRSRRVSVPPPHNNL